MIPSCTHHTVQTVMLVRQLPAASTSMLRFPLLFHRSSSLPILFPLPPASPKRPNVLRALYKSRLIFRCLNIILHYPVPFVKSNSGKKGQTLIAIAQEDASLWHPLPLLSTNFTNHLKHISPVDLNLAQRRKRRRIICLNQITEFNPLSPRSHFPGWAVI